MVVKSGALLGVLCSLIVVCSGSGFVLQPEPLETATLVSLRNDTNATEGGIQHISSGTNTATICFLVLISIHAVITLVLFTLNQIKTLYDPFHEEKSEVNTPDLYESLRASTSLVPVSCLVMIFIIFRASNQNINTDTDQNYRITEFGMCGLTLGVIFQILCVCVTTDLFRDALDAFGTLCSIVGMIVLSVGLFTVRNAVVPFTTTEACFVALTLLVIVTNCATKGMHFHRRYFGGENLPSTDQVLENAHAALAFITIIMCAFFYVHFRYLNLGEIPNLTETSVAIATGGIFGQIFAIFLTLVHERSGGVIRFIAVTLTFIAFTIVVASTISNDWPTPSIATQIALILLLLLAVAKLFTVISQEIWFYFSQHHLSAAHLKKILTDMLASSELITIACIALLYLHFRIAFILLEDPKQFIEDQKVVTPLFHALGVAIFVQFAAQLLELVIGSSSVMSMLTGMMAVGVGVCVGGIVVIAMFA